MIQITEKVNCCGCTACAKSCPVKAIEMIKDTEGFAYPSVDKHKCINCNLCEKVCPYINQSRPKNDLQKTFVAFNLNDAQREKSSSGGMFILLAAEIIKRGGTVFAAGYDNNWCAVHKRADNFKELDELIGSKYMQSELGDTFPQIKEILEKKHVVLMVGTTCQINGLKNYLQKDYSNLYCIDFICLGVPSSQIWKDYLTTFFDKEKITHINFKDKSFGWHKFSLNIEYPDYKHTVEGKKTYFFTGYFDHLYTRPSCSNCVCKKGNRSSDITISDCWGYDKIAPEMDDNKGMSSVICHTEKGFELFKSVQNQLLWKEGNFKDILRYNPGYVKSSPMGKDREAFWNDYNTLSKEKIFKKYCKFPKRSYLKKGLIKIKRRVKNFVRAH